MTVFQFCKYWRNSFFHIQRTSWRFLYGLRHDFNFILCSSVFLTFKQSETVSIIEHKFAVAANSAEPVTKNTFPTVSLNTLAANHLFITEYGVKFTSSYFHFGNNFNQGPNFHSTGEICVTRAGKIHYSRDTWKKGNFSESFKMLRKPASTYNKELNSSRSLVESRCTPPLWITFYDNLRTTYAILMKVCPSAQNLVTSILQLKCPLLWPLSMHNRCSF